MALSKPAWAVTLRVINTKPGLAPAPAWASHYGGQAASVPVCPGKHGSHRPTGGDKVIIVRFVAGGTCTGGCVRAEQIRSINSNGTHPEGASVASRSDYFRHRVSLWQPAGAMHDLPIRDMKDGPGQLDADQRGENQRCPPLRL
jgi:hypothetical protein